MIFADVTESHAAPGYSRALLIKWGDFPSRSNTVAKPKFPTGDQETDFLALSCELDALLRVIV